MAEVEVFVPLQEHSTQNTYNEMSVNTFNQHNYYYLNNQPQQQPSTNPRCASKRCSNQYEPVCSQKNITYRNVCTMECLFGDSYSHDGECQTSYPNCNCSFRIDKVCGVNGFTYDNQCMLECDRMQKEKDGACYQTCDCPSFYEPICGRDGQTYKNRCELDCVGVGIDYYGACDNKGSNPCGCIGWCEDGACD